MSTKEKYASGDYVVLKSGGPKMMVKWYLGPTEVEASWDEGRQEHSGRFDESELAFYQSFDDNGIYIIEVNDAEEIF